MSADRVPLADQIACVARECDVRARVYPRWVEEGRMKPEAAARGLAAMRAALVTLMQVEAGEAGEP